jgi:hypothetical protein
MPKRPKSTTRLFVGIDPGKNGGIVVLSEHITADIFYTKMPTTLHALWTYINCIGSQYEVPNISTVIEQVNSMPGEGHKGAFTFGTGFGSLQMAVIAARHSYELVLPRRWQQEFGIVARTKKEPKQLLKRRCQDKATQLFPRLDLWTKDRSVGLQRAICDALLLAEYARRAGTGNLRRGT